MFNQIREMHFKTREERNRIIQDIKNLQETHKVLRLDGLNAETMEKIYTDHPWLRVVGAVGKEAGSILGPISGAFR